MEVESSSRKKEELPMLTKRRRRRRRCVCLCITAVVLALGLLLLILALTVFKAKRPVTVVNSVSLRDLDLSLDILRVRVAFNLTLDADVTVENPNRVSFKYSNTTCFLSYRGDEVGEVPLPAGKIGARDTRGLNLTLTLMADQLLSNPDFFSDAMSGTLKFQTYMRISGKVRILFDIHIVSYSSCDLEIDISNRKVSKQTCQYKNKL